MTKQTWTAAVSALLFVALAAVVSLTPVPFVSWSPGTTVDLFEPVDGQPRVDIQGVATHPGTGQLRLTTVSVTRADSQLTLPEALLSYWLSAREVLPREAVYPPGVSVDEIRAREVQMMDTSQSAAVAAGLRAAGEKVVEYPMVTGVSNGSPADGKLRPGDFILRINDKPVKTTRAVGAEISKSAVGDPILFTLLRDRAETRETVITVSANANPAQPVVGINLGIGYSYVPRVNFRINPDIGGPSAGLIFALAVYDLVSPDDLIAGRSVAGTGTIDGDGAVHGIGGIQEKIAGAEAAGVTVFLVPADNCPDVVGLSTPVRLVRVSTLSEAIAALEDLKDPARAAKVVGCS
ncbi:MAG: PDZ domain-containing protein [Micropruina sp.]|uniref:YlbL family protein n=1 Tax=Micropruina sp. TaxID=2737536 RepID=UPI0039E6D2F7